VQEAFCGMIIMTVRQTEIRDPPSIARRLFWDREVIGITARRSRNAGSVVLYT
jgi:hypothetical protein